MELGNIPILGCDFFARASHLTHTRHPQIEDESPLEIRLHPTQEDVYMVEFPSLDNPTRIVLSLHNTSLSTCNESLYHWRELDDDADDDNQKQQKDHWSTNLMSFIDVHLDDSYRSGVLEIKHISEHGVKDIALNRECGVYLDLIDYEVDPYKEVTFSVGLVDGFEDAFFCTDCHSDKSNVPEDEMCFYYLEFNFQLIAIFFISDCVDLCI